MAKQHDVAVGRGIDRFPLDRHFHQMWADPLEPVHLQVASPEPGGESIEFRVLHGRGGGVQGGEKSDKAQRQQGSH